MQAFAELPAVIIRGAIVVVINQSLTLSPVHVSQFMPNLCRSCVRDTRYYENAGTFGKSEYDEKEMCRCGSDINYRTRSPNNLGSVYRDLTKVQTETDI